MHPHANTLWRGPRWLLAVILALLGMIGPFSIDTYIPAFAGIAKTLSASPTQMQQTLSAYLFGFAFMNLFHGALSDSLGRKRVIITGLIAFALASIGCALAQSIEQLIACRALQGFSTGAGIVVSRAVVRDLFAPADAQRMMSQITIFFGLAPAIAPIIGGWLFVYSDWHFIFWFLAVLGMGLAILTWRYLPETLHPSQRQSFSTGNLLRGYWQLGLSGRFLLLCLASGVPFNGMFLYVLSAPEFLGTHLKLAPTQFYGLFMLTIGGIMAGAWLSGRMAGKVPPKRQIRHGFVIMLAVSLINVVANLLFTPHVSWALIPIALFAFGWSMMVPAVTLLALDQYPERRGMASSLQMFIGSTANGIVAGVISPLVMHNTVHLALTSLAMLCVGLIAWVYLHRRWPEIGKLAQ